MALTFDAQDMNDIAAATTAGGDVWENGILKRLKRKIKDHFKVNETVKCCYCSKLFKGEFNMVIDIEHVLPQAHYPTERFNMSNLNIACKRCNMLIKGSDTSFIVNKVAMGTNYYQSNHYKLIHPNLDVYADHLLYIEIREGDLVYIKYIPRTKNGKGEYTYDYFELKEMEIDTINKAQGLSNAGIKAILLRGSFRKKLLQLLKKI